MILPKKRIRVLCVDDEPNILEGLKVHLGRNFDMLTANGKEKPNYGGCQRRALRRDRYRYANAWDERHPNFLDRQSRLLPTQPLSC